MSMTVVVTRDVPERFRGFLASVMLGIAPCVYTHPDLSRAVRERIWAVLEDWHARMKAGSIVMTWADGCAPSGQRVCTLGWPARVIVACDGVALSHRDLTEVERRIFENKMDR